MELQLNGSSHAHFVAKVVLHRLHFVLECVLEVAWRLLMFALLLAVEFLSDEVAPWDHVLVQLVSVHLLVQL